MVANGSSVGYGFYGRDQAGGSDPTVSAGGLLQNFTGSDTLASDFFSYIPNVPFSATLSLSAGSYIGLVDESGGSMLANSDFANTFSFVTDGPVFDLPAGYTVNSPSAHIVNNRFVLAATPEPASFAALGLGVLAAIRRRKRASPRERKEGGRGA